MDNLPYRTVTTGRTLFNCSALQWEQFIDPERCVPRAGLLEVAMKELGFELTTMGSLFYIHDDQGVRYAEAARTKRQALTTWWRKIGLKKTKERREEERAWEAMPTQGRPATEATAASRHYIDRSKQREHSLHRIESVWMEACKVLVKHSPQAEVWTTMAMQRELPRRHSVRKVSLRRALVEAVAALYEVYGECQTFRDYFDQTLEVQDAVVSEHLMIGAQSAACNGDVATTMPRVALAVALILSPEPPEVLFKELRQVLLDHQIISVDDLKILVETALDGKLLWR